MTRTAADEGYMALAIQEAEAAAGLGEVPVGAVVVIGGRVVARGRNRREAEQDPSAHAEMIALREAASVLKSWRLPGSTLYVTLEPWTMCMGAALLARVERIVFGAWDPKGGAAGSVLDVSDLPQLNHRIEVVGGVCEPACAALLSSFFLKLRGERRRSPSGGGERGRATQ